MIFSNAPKFVINLERRKDRLESIKKEMEYIGWEYEYFPAVDTNSHIGCTMSHLEIIKLAKKRNYEKVLVIEDDCIIMPYAKSLIKKIENETENLDFAIINLSPTINRPVNLSNKHRWFLDITNLPPKQEHHRGIYATNMIMYHSSIYDNVLEIEDPLKITHYAIDDFIYQFITSKYHSYAPINPIGPQIQNWSDVSHGIYNNFYTQIYNWNLYSPIKIADSYRNFEEIKKIKEKNLHKEYKYES